MGNPEPSLRRNLEKGVETIPYGSSHMLEDACSAKRLGPTRLSNVDSSHGYDIVHPTRNGGQNVTGWS